VNTKFFGSEAEMIRQYDDDVSTGFHPKGTDYKSVVTHEIAHALDGFLSKKGIAGSKAYSTDANGFSGILRRKVLRKPKLTKNDVW
jgi:hypothetical protein